MTGSIRLFVADRLSQGTGFMLAPEQAHYLGNVMRQGVGDHVCLFNGQDGEWLARIDSIRKDRCLVLPERQTRPQQGEPPLTLVFAPLKRDNTHLVVEKATELGATRLLPVFTERTNTQRLNLDRLSAIAREAAEQCERLSVPDIAEPMPLYSLLSNWNSNETLHTAIERSGAATPVSALGPRALLIGPEGGFTKPELDLLHRTPFVRPVGLGPRVLRAETAAIVGLALLQAATWNSSSAAAAKAEG
ncbi:MAG: 16S rRNA (uracil(1498)-N(3))-methyltransferase [Acetobacteraceae bacterium]|nr:16S rRNA (uracil(1498)-N(3))-methyltransferase [Acetobacteraceae bacterium]